MNTIVPTTEYSVEAYRASIELGRKLGPLSLEASWIIEAATHALVWEEEPKIGPTPAKRGVTVEKVKKAMEFIKKMELSEDRLRYLRGMAFGAQLGPR
jgi:hypothetical protein